MSGYEYEREPSVAKADQIHAEALDTLRGSESFMLVVCRDGDEGRELEAVFSCSMNERIAMALLVLESMALVALEEGAPGMAARFGAVWGMLCEATS